MEDKNIEKNELLSDLLTNSVRDVILKELNQTLVNYSSLKDIMDRTPKGTRFTRAEVGFMRLYDIIQDLAELTESGRV